MSLVKYTEMKDGLYIDGEIEAGILYEGDSICIGRLIFATRFLEAESDDKYNPMTIITFLRYQEEKYPSSQRVSVRRNNNIQIYLPTAKLEHIIQVLHAHYINRQYFVMSIEDVFIVKGRGVCIAGYGYYGWIRHGDKVRLTNNFIDYIETRVKDFMIFGHADSLGAGDNIGLLLEGVSLEDVKGKLIATSEGLDE